MDAGERGLRAESLRELDRRVVAALVRARAHLGLDSRAEFAKLMDRATGGEGPDVSTYNKWENGSVRPPAWALYLAAQISGLGGKLLKEMEPTEEPRPEHVARIARNEREIDELKAAAEAREEWHAQKYDELSAKVEGTTEAVKRLNDELRRRANPSSTEQVAGS